MKSSNRLVVMALGAVALVGCGSTVVAAPDAAVTPTDTPVAMDAPPVTDTPVVTDTPRVDTPPMPRVPRRHRATAMTCPATRPPATCDPGMGGPPSACRVDADCAMGVNGRCVGNPHDGCRCSYDVCTTDATCTTGGPCECRLASRGGGGANVCMGGNCQTDSNCGAGGYCSPSLGSCGDFGGTVGYYCHTPADECVDDEDCAGFDAGFLGQNPYCMYARESGRWVCSNSGCAG